MKNFIVPPSVLASICLLAAVLIGIQGGVYKYFIKGDGPEVAVNTTCKVVDIAIKDNDKVILELDCQGQKATMRDTEVLVNYFNNPGPLICTVYESGKAKCKLDKQNAEAPSP